MNRSGRLLLFFPLLAWLWAPPALCAALEAESARLLAWGAFPALFGSKEAAPSRPLETVEKKIGNSPQPQSAAPSPDVSPPSPAPPPPVIANTDKGAASASAAQSFGEAPPPSPSAPETAKKNPPPRLFGTVEFRGSLKNITEWMNVLERNEKNPVLKPGSRLNSLMTWDNLVNILRNKPPMEVLRAVNSFWNQWPYRLDKNLYGKEDYWAAPYEFVKNSGDCEDYSIVKYFTLKGIGYDPDSMRIVVVRDVVRNIAHAVLAVYLNDDVYILDNTSNAVLSHTRLKNYVPQYSVSEKYRWIHVRPR